MKKINLLILLSIILVSCTSSNDALDNDNSFNYPEEKIELSSSNEGGGNEGDTGNDGVRR